jgi:hypothetical protein
VIRLEYTLSTFKSVDTLPGAGNVPVRKFEKTYNDCMAEFSSTAGMDPVNSLLNRYNASRLLMLPKLFEIVPLKRFENTLKYIKPFIVLIVEGIVPES